MLFIEEKSDFVSKQSNVGKQILLEYLSIQTRLRMDRMDCDEKKILFIFKIRLSELLRQKMAIIFFCPSLFKC